VNERSVAASTADSARGGHLRALTPVVDSATVRSFAPPHPTHRGEPSRERTPFDVTTPIVAMTAPAPRSFAMHEIAARAWFYLSPFPAERGLAARRYREHSALAEADHLLQIIGELAIERYHARAISAVIIVDRTKRIPNEANAIAVANLLAGLVRKMRAPR